MERLTVKRKDGRWALANSADASKLSMMDKITLAIDRLAEYEDAEDRGLLVRLPCWIPVTERLPEDRRDVLVYAGVLFSYITVGYYDGLWKFSYDDEKIAGGAVYWMPLPKPPKEE